MPTDPTVAATAAGTSPVVPSVAPAAPARSPLAGLPSLVPTLPDAGRRVTLPPLAGSADALALSQLAENAFAKQRTLAIVCADSLSAQRLTEEIAAFAPARRIAFFPDWETLPYDPISPHQDLVSERLATLYRLSRDDCDVLLLAASTAMQRVAPPQLPRSAHVLSQTGRPVRRRSLSRAARAGRLHARDAGRVARGVQRPRWPHRPLPDGLRAAVSHRPLR